MSVTVGGRSSSEQGMFTFRPFLYKIAYFVVLNFSHFISQTCTFVNLVKLCL